MERKTDMAVSPYTLIERPSQMLRERIQRLVELECGILPRSANKENDVKPFKLVEYKHDEKSQIFFHTPFFTQID
jgi:hypothetical protein